MKEVVEGDGRIEEKCILFAALLVLRTNRQPHGSRRQ